MRRTRTIGLAMVASLAVWTAGGPTAVSAADVTLTVSRWAGPQADAQKQLLDEYGKETGVTIKLDAIDYGQLKQKQTLQHEHEDRRIRPDLRAGGLVRRVHEGGLSRAARRLREGHEADRARAGTSRISPRPALTSIRRTARCRLCPISRRRRCSSYDKDALEAGGLQAAEDLGRTARSCRSTSRSMAPASRCRSARDRRSPTSWPILLAGDGTSFFDANGKLDLTQPAVVETVKFMQELGKIRPQRQQWLALGRGEQGAAVRPGADGHHRVRPVHGA